MDRAIIAGTKYDRGVVVLYPDDLSSLEFQIDGDGSGWGVLCGVQVVHRVALVVHQ